ncbi:MAG: tetratricopeptide repeat protein [Planctomycetota bacterium]|jgi:tetratricopeptide (TPR) repeat protein
MARKRLNKKVALIGSVVLILLGLAIIYLIPKLSLRLGLIGPETFIEDGDAAIKAAHEATDEQTREEEYKKAISCYHKARSLARTDSLRIKMLFKLVDIYIETDRWRNVRGCWNDIISIDTKNPKARFGRLKYFYIIADSGMLQVWREVASQASEFIEVADANLLVEDTAKWETFGTQEASGQRLGPYLYLLRGRANLEIAKMGAATDPEELLVKAIADLEKVRELEPSDPQVYWYLAQAVKAKGEILASRGDFKERDRAAEQARQILKRIVEVAGADPRAHINLLKEKLNQSSVGTRPQEQIQLLEPEYLLLVEKFPSSAEAFSALAELYQWLGHKSLDKAIEAAEKAIELDKPNVTYAINAANLHYRKFSIYRQNQEIYKAIEVAENAITLPDAQEVNGPRHGANLMNKISLYTFLANCYIEQILEPCEVRTESQAQEWMTDAEQAVRGIEQLFESGQEPQVIKWQGMLELAKGNRNIAVRKLYKTYELLKASGQSDPQVSYALAKIFKNTTEVGAVREFLESALNAHIEWTKPEAILDYVDVLLKLRAYNAALSVVNSFEDNFWPDRRSQTLRINALLGARQFDEAEAELAKAKPDDTNTIKLNLALVQAKIGQVQTIIARKRIKESSPIIFEGMEIPEKENGQTQDSVQVMTDELKGYWTVCAGLVEKLLTIEPNSVGETSVVAVCNNYISQGRIEQAGGIVNKFLGYFPDSTTLLFYKRVLAESEPNKVSLQRRKEIEEQVLSEIGEPISRAVKLGFFYHRHEELDKAADEFKKVFVSSVALDAYREKENTQYEIAVSYLFEIALEKKDWELAQEIVETVRRENIDRCSGQFFAARAAVAKEEYKDALARLEECLNQRPVFSHGFMLRSNVNAILGNEPASIEDARNAASLNPLDGTIAKVLASVLYQRNKGFGLNVSSAQVIEARDALDNAMALNPGDMELLSGYAEYISPTSEVQALAIRQYVQKTTPSVKNAVLLGRLATKMALEETDVERKEALFAIADSSFKQAIAIDPQDKAARDSFAEYYRLSGQGEKAEKLLEKDRELLWRHYFRSGRFEDARGVLEQLYKTEAKNSDVVKGLLLVAEMTVDKEAVQKYSKELLLIEDSVENNLIQIRTFLKIGLVKEVEYKIQSFKEKYPNERRALLLEAWLAMRQGRLKEALDLTTRSLESDQNNALAWRVRGEVNFLMANYYKAVDDLNKSKSLSPELDTHIALAKAYQRAGRNEDAILELKKCIIDQPQTAAQEVPAERGARVLLEQIYLQLGRKEALKIFYDETLRKFPDSIQWYNRAGAFAIAEGQFDRAEQVYGQAWQKGQKGSGAPKRYERRLGPRAAAFDGYLQALVLSGKFDKVFEEAGQYVDRDLAPIAYLRMAEAKLKLGDKTIAIEYCRKAVDKAGTNEVFAFLVSQRMHSLLGTEEAMRHCEERLEANPDSLAANLTMFNLAKIDGEYNKALRYIDKCLQIAGPDSSARVAYTMIKSEVLHLAYEKTSDNNYLKRAIVVYESLLAEMPNSTSILNNLAYMLAQNNERLDEALTFAGRALDARPNAPNFLDTYAYVLYKNGRNSEAAEFLQAALQQYEQNNIPVPAEVYEHLGQIREKLGAKTGALAAYKQALEIVLNSTDKASKAAKQRITSAIERLTLIVDK